MGPALGCPARQGQRWNPASPLQLRVPLGSFWNMEFMFLPLGGNWEAIRIRRSHRRSGSPAFVPGPAHILSPCSIVRIYLLSASQ